MYIGGNGFVEKKLTTPYMPTVHGYHIVWLLQLVPGAGSTLCAILHILRAPYGVLQVLHPQQGVDPQCRFLFILPPPQEP